MNPPLIQLIIMLNSFNAYRTMDWLRDLTNLNKACFASTYMQEKKEKWNDYLDTCLFAYNTSKHESTKYTPFEIMF